MWLALPGDSPNQVLTHAARAAAKQLNKHLRKSTDMCVRAARDRAEMWQIGPRISSVTGCYPYSSTGLRGSTVYFHDVPTVDTIAM